MLSNPALPKALQRIPPTERWISVGLALIIVVVIVASLFSLTTFPPVFIDEPWYSNAAWNLVTKGANFDSMYTGVLDQWQPAWVRWPFIGNLPLAAAFALGGLGLFQARLTSWLFGILLLGFVFALGRRLYSTLTGALAAALLALSYVYLQASHYARVDIFLACVVVIATYLFVIGLQENKPWAFFASSLIIGLSVDIHMNGALFAISLLTLLIAAYGRQVLRFRQSWYFGAGAILAVIYYWAVHIAPNPATYFQLSRGWQGSMMLPPLATLDPIAILRSLANEVGRYHFYDYSLDFALIGGSILFYLGRHTPADRMLITFTGISFLLFVLFVQSKHDIYAILFYPWFLLMVAETLVSLLRESHRLMPQRLFVSAILVLFMFNGAMHIARPLSASRGYNYYDITDRIKSTIPAGARVAGLPNWWLGLVDYDYRSIMSLTYYQFFNGYTLTQGLEQMHPDYIIVDTGLQGLLVDKDYFPTEPGFTMYGLPRKEFHDFLALRGHKIGEFSNEWHGQFEIYEIKWD